MPPKCQMSTEFSSGVIQTRAKLPCWVCDGQFAWGKALLSPCLRNHFGSPAAGGYCAWFSNKPAVVKYVKQMCNCVKYNFL